MKVTPLVLRTTLLLAPLLAGCAGSEAPASTTAPSSLPAALAGAPISGGVAGFVIDTAFRAIADAAIEVIEGPDLGASARSDADGQFSLQGQTFRATKAGYISATQSIRTSSPGGRPWVIFNLQPESPPPLSIAGDYTLTLTADAACAANLPHEARTRSYAVTILSSDNTYSPVDTNFDVAFKGVTISDYWDMSIGVAGNFVGFGIYGGHNPFLLEWLTQDTHLAFSGTAPGVSVASSRVATISTSFDGIIDYCASASRIARIDGDCAAPVDRCEARNHQLTLTRR